MRFQLGDQVIVSDPGGSYLRAMIAQYTGVADKGDSLWLIKPFGADQPYPVMEGCIAPLPAEPIDRNLASVGLSRSDVPTLFAEQGLDADTASHWLSIGGSVLAWIVQEGVRLRMRLPAYGLVSVIYCSRSLSEPGFGHFHIKQFQTVADAMVFCRTSQGTPEFRDPWIQPVWGEESIWSPYELERELSSS